MANANRRVTSKQSISTGALGWITAGVMLFLGAALQLGELGYGPYQPVNRWLFSVFADAAWRMLTLLDGAMLRYILQNWPLLLILSGLAILPLAWHGNRSRAQFAAGSGNGEEHGS